MPRIETAAVAAMGSRQVQSGHFVIQGVDEEAPLASEDDDDWLAAEIATGLTSPATMP